MNIQGYPIFAPGEAKTKEHFPDAGDVRCSTEDIRFILHGG